MLNLNPVEKLNLILDHFFYDTHVNGLVIISNPGSGMMYSLTQYLDENRVKYVGKNGIRFMKADRFFEFMGNHDSEAVVLNIVNDELLPDSTDRKEICRMITTATALRQRRIIEYAGDGFKFHGKIIFYVRSGDELPNDITKQCMHLKFT